MGEKQRVSQGAQCRQEEGGPQSKRLAGSVAEKSDLKARWVFGRTVQGHSTGCKRELEIR